jgi:hypothetical protein
MGGPSNGQTFKALSRWPSYLAPDGGTMNTMTGDRIVRGAGRQVGCYVLTRIEGKPWGYVWRPRVRGVQG